MTGFQGKIYRLELKINKRIVGTGNDVQDADSEEKERTNIPHGLIQDVLSKADIQFGCQGFKQGSNGNQTDDPKCRIVDHLDQEIVQISGSSVSSDHAA